MTMRSRPLETMRRFVSDARAGATAIAAVAVTVMTVGGAALIGDHAWLIDQRDVLKAAADAAGIAATLEMARLAGQTHTDDELKAELKLVAERYILLNLKHLPPNDTRRRRRVSINPAALSSTSTGTPTRWR